MDSHRLATTSTTPSVDRQTPKADFGDHLSALAATVGNVVGVVVPGAPLVSAAVASMRTAFAVSGVTSVSQSHSPSAALVPGGKGDSWDLLAAQDSQSKEYLSLQNEMQRESRQFNAVSNVLKVRHDSAKAAINNIR